MHGRFEKKKEKKSLGVKKILLILLVALLILLIAAVIGAVVYYNSMLNKMNRVEVPKINYTQAATEQTLPPETQAVTEAAETVVTETTEPPHVPSSADYLNILVVGQAAREGEAERFADSMILCTINTHEKTLTMTSMLRDAFAKMPDYKGHTGGRIKLTTIYHLGSFYSGGDVAGSMELMNQALYDNFGIEVDHNFEVDFDIFIKVVDALQGIEIELTQEEADYLNDPKQKNWVYYDVQPGWFSLDGSGALAFARMRKAEGDNDSDIKRTSRQRRVVEAILSKVRQKSLSELQEVINVALPMVTTSMSNAQITETLATLLPMLPELKILPGGTCPAEYKGEYVDIYGDGFQHSVLRFDAATNKKIMRAITEGEGVVETKPAN